MRKLLRLKWLKRKKIMVKVNNVIYPSIKEAAYELGMSKATLCRWVRDERKISYEVV